MKFSEIKDLTVEELRKRMLSSREELFELTMKHSMGQLAAPTDVTKKRKTIAKIKTALSMKMKSTRGQK